MRTTIDLPDSLYREAKTHAIQNGLKFKDMVAQFIEAGLRGRLQPEHPLRRDEVPLPVFRGAVGPSIPSRSNAELFEILDEDSL